MIDYMTMCLGASVLLKWYVMVRVALAHIIQGVLAVGCRSYCMLDSMIMEGTIHDILCGINQHQ